MNKAITIELQFFLISILWGAIILLVYDVFRILRRLIKHNWFFVAIEDLLFWVVSSVFIFAMMYQENNGIIRGFSVMGMGIGMVLYHYILSELLISAVTKLIYTLFRPFIFVVNKIKGFLGYVKKKLKKLFGFLLLRLKRKMKSVKMVLNERQKKRLLKNEIRRSKKAEEKKVKTEKKLVEKKKKENQSKSKKEQAERKKMQKSVDHKKKVGPNHQNNQKNILKTEKKEAIQKTVNLEKYKG
ncbi:MAG: hypothetical protein K0S76_2513 [Herbinix sp.]|jgi:spore cortex biosynthesis protein YabQ|nr:hypothetical protein [Herbinix sp.]